MMPAAMATVLALLVDTIAVVLIVLVEEKFDEVEMVSNLVDSSLVASGRDTVVGTSACGSIDVVTVVAGECVAVGGNVVPVVSGAVVPLDGGDIGGGDVAPVIGGEIKDAVDNGVAGSDDVVGEVVMVPGWQVEVLV